MKMDLPNRFKASDTERLLPVVVGLGLLGAGLALWRWKPGVLSLPDPAPIDSKARPTMVVSAAHKTRDGIAKVLPPNLASSLSRSLVITGTALLLTRLLDEITGQGRGPR